MNITTLAGHLTTHDKRVIVELLQHGLKAGRTPRKLVELTIDGNRVTATITTRETDSFGRMSEKTNRAMFTVKGGAQ